MTTTERLLSAQKLLCRWRGEIAAVLVLLAFEVFFSRSLWGSGSGAMAGDDGDGRFVMLCAEHWFRALTGQEPYLSLPIFFPETDALAWSDLVLGFAPFHCLFRALGMGMHLAFKSTLMCVHALGTLCMFLFLRRRPLCLGLFPALIGAVFFGGSQVLVPSFHPQLFAVCFLPLTGICLGNFWQWARRDLGTGICTFRSRLPWGIASVFLIALLPCTSFYIGAFADLFLALFALFGLAILGARLAAPSGRERRRTLLSFLRRHWWEACIYAALFVAFMAPFIAFELPAQRTFGPRPWELIVRHLPALPLGLWNVHDSNLLFGWMRRAFGLTGAHELQVGYLPTAVFLALAALVWSAWTLWQSRASESRAQRPHLAAFTLAFGLAALLLALMGTRTPGGLSLWKFVWKFIPGFSAIRAISRVHVFLAFPVAMLSALGAEALLNCLRKNRLWLRRILGVSLTLLTLASTIWTGGVVCRWSADWDRHELTLISPPPKDCRVIALADSGVRGHYRYYFEYQLLAWEAANRFGVPTAFGYSGQHPIGWELEGVTGREMEARLLDWADLKGLTQLCAFDFGQRKWRFLRGEALGEEARP